MQRITFWSGYVKKTNSQLDHYTELENDIKPELKEAVILLTQELPKPTEQMSIEELESHLLSLSDLHYQVAKLKRKGLSEHVIAKQLGLSVLKVKHMIRSFLNLSYRLMPQETEELRTELLHQLDDMLYGLYEEAANDGYNNLTSRQLPSALGILDRKIKLLNIEPPKKVELTVSQEIIQAKHQLDKIFETYKIDAIDVTPTEEKE